MKTVPSLIGDGYSRHSGIYTTEVWQDKLPDLSARGEGAIEEILLCIETPAVGAMAERYQTPAPIEFQKLLHLLDDAPELLTAIDELLIKKQAAPEMGLAPQVPILNQFIEAELSRLESAHIEHIARPNVIDSLNALLHETVHRR